MGPVMMQRDLVVNLKRETCLNMVVLSKLRPMSTELSRQIFKENAVEKPTQNMFNHFAYYLVSIIDTSIADKFSWPLYDTKTEREFRSQLSSFINDYSSKGFLSPVMSSYLVNPGCYKVTMLMFQMSQLAVQRLLLSKLSKDSKKDMYNKMTEKYKSSTEDFVADINKEIEVILNKFYNHQRKRVATEKIASLFRERIISMEQKLSLLNTQKFIDNLINNYVQENVLDEATKTEILKIKDVNSPASFFDCWLQYVDDNVSDMESKWDEKMTPFLKICTECHKNTNALLVRNTGEADSNSYMIEYNHVTDDICTIELQFQVNSQQKYILKNIVQNERLYFPNLIRSFLISICYILKNNEIGDEIFKFNEYLQDRHRTLNELVSALRMLNNRVMNAEARLQPSQLLFDQSISVKDFEIPPLPDLSGVKANRDSTGQVLFHTFTPLSISKHKFNLRRKHNSFSFAKPQTKSLITPFHQGTKDDFLKSLISCRVSSYDRANVSHNFHSVSLISQATTKGNETIAECSTGFTKQQILRLLSTKKSSSSKKFKYKNDRLNINVKKGGLFHESAVSNDSDDSNGLFRSYSSPNLNDNREKRGVKQGKRKLSVMRENYPSLLEMSGIVALDKDDTAGKQEDSGKMIDATIVPVINIPVIKITSPKKGISRTFKCDIFKEADLDKEMEDNCFNLKSASDKSPQSFNKDKSKTETPKTNLELIKKTSSLEKIINRFKKVGTYPITTDSKDEDDFTTIVEVKENTSNVNVDVFTANKILLPDLLSPSCSVLDTKSNDCMDQLFPETDKDIRKTRQSLGTLLCVDDTFLASLNDSDLKD